MKRFFSLSLLTLTLLISTVGMAPVVHAQGVSCSTAGSDPDTCIPDGPDTAVGGEGVVNPQAAGAISEGEKAPAAKEGDPADAYGSVMQWILKLFAWLLGVAALTLNYAVYYTVVMMGSYVKDLSAIGVTWTILRDIGNIFLIFGFLAVGVTTILNVDWYGKGTKMLPMMFIAAVFLNFSLFFTEAIIDTGNLFATQFYTQIIGGGQIPPPSFSLTSVNQEGISNKIMNKLGLQTLYGDGTANTAIFKGANSWIVGFMGVILFIVTAFVFFTLAFVLIARFVILIFLIILAPVGFAGLAVPMLAKRAGEWWSKLFEQTITAPILMLMLYVALAVITDVKFLTGFGMQTITGGAATGFVDNYNLVGFGSFILSFIVAMGLLIVVVIQSKNLSAFGASWASKTAGALTFGATAWAGRTGIGWGANRAAKYLRSTRLGRVPLVGTGIVKGFDKVASGSFDVRGATLGGGLKAAGINAGDAQKGGYKADLKERIESRTKYAGELKGRELTDMEKARQAILQKEIADENKKLNEARMQFARTKDPMFQTQISVLEHNLAPLTKELDDLERVTDKGAQRKYAGNLELDYLGLSKDSFFNKYINLAANTEAAKKIRDEAKKSSDDKTMDAFKKALKKIGEEEKPEEKKEEKKEEEKKPEPPKA